MTKEMILEHQGERKNKGKSTNMGKYNTASLSEKAVYRKKKNSLNIQ